ncbi:Protein of unknown function (DUF2031), putative [Plasmodium chabaudi adami]|uniref:Fam-b protein n=1 Tax=Plasmodium chabaudi adami TaxID=5826 RepID=A0A1D3L886_PLACE|nr:Protein of unknown function (DUF2031), putative [Plasmodium chabaudi adami]
MLADVDNQFYLNNFYESNLNLVDAFNDDGIKYIQNILDEDIKKCKLSNMLFKLKGINMGIKILIHKVVMKLSKIPKKKNKPFKQLRSATSTLNIDYDNFENEYNEIL